MFAAYRVVAQPNAWINEFHYDNSGSDTGEFVEIVIENPGDFDLSLLKLTEYNGSDSSVIDTHTTDTFIEGETSNTYVVYHLNIDGIQNGDPDGFSLDYNNTLLQFISYGGTITAVDGPASGQTSTDIGVTESNSSTQVGYSLQLNGTGLEYGAFTWQDPRDDSPGQVNSGQILHPTIQFDATSLSVEENQGAFSVTTSIIQPDGYEVSFDIVFQTSASSSVSEDFTGGVTQTITFPTDATDGDTKTASFTINDDSEYEGEEKAVFLISNISTSGGTQIGSPNSFELTISDNDKPSVVINEFLADPASGSGGDANNDGATDSNDDEFIELLNTENVSVDIGGWSLYEDTGEQFTFPSNTILPANSGIVVFGGGIPTGSFGGSKVFTTSTLSLNNGSDTPTLMDQNGNLIDSISYGGNGEPDADINESLVRDPEGSGSFVAHSGASVSGGALFSPGTKTDGTNFTNSVTIEGNAGWRMLAAPVADMPISDLTDDAPIQGYPGHNEGFDKNFYVGYDGSNFIPADDINGRIEDGKGFLLYFFNNDKAGSSDLPVTIDATPGTEHTADVTGVSLHSSGDKWNILGNPFETAIDISNIDSWVTGGTLQSTVGQIWDDESGSFVTTTTNNGKVASWQGFFIQNNDAGSIDIPISAKTTGTDFYKETTDEGYLAFTLTGTHSSQDISTTDKAAVLYFSADASHNLDTYDAAKLLPLTSRYALIGFSSQNEAETDGNVVSLKAQESRPINFEGDLSFDLQLKTQNMQGDFKITWEQKDLPESWELTLIDNQTGEELNMNENESYSFSYNPREKAQPISNESNIMQSLPVAATVKAKQDQNPRFSLKVSSPTSETESASEIPESVKLNPNYPNPFNPSTTISYELTEQAHVILNVYTIVGQKVATLVDEVRDVGQHEETWNATEMPSGIYIAQLEVQGKVYIRKMTLIK